MKSVSMGGLDAVLTGGTDREGGGTGPLVVLLHGFGAPGDDLVSLHRVIDAPAGTRFLFPVAPLALPPAYGAGRAWWHIDMVALDRAMRDGTARNLSRDVPEGLAEARGMMKALLEEAASKLSPSSIVLGGFSQGAMLSCDVALHSDVALGGLVLFSGTLLAEDEWTPRMAARKGLRVLQSHGRQDPLLPFEMAERLRDLLKEAGLDVTWIPFNGGHGIPPAAMDALRPFLAACASLGTKTGT
jgi:phospholipase/carboxylesterase